MAEIGKAEQNPPGRARTAAKKAAANSDQLPAVRKRRQSVQKSRARELLGIPATTKYDRLVDAVRKGLPYESLKKLAGELRMSESRFGEEYLRMSPSTTSRRRRSGVLSEEESDRAVRFARLIEQAIELHEGDEDAARRWLTSPLPHFEEESPLGYSRTEAGYREVEELIIRLEHGMFS